MNLLHMVGTLSPAAGGPTEAIRLLLRYAPPGVHGEVATLDDPAAPFLADLPFPVHAFGTASPRWYSPRLAPWLRRHARPHGRFDGIVIHGLWEYPGLAARLAAPHLPRLVFPHGMLDPWFRRAAPGKHLKKSLYWLLAESGNLRSATRVLFTTPTERDLAAHTFWPSRWTSALCPLGAEPAPSDTAPLLAAFHARCPALAGQRFLLFLGRLDPKKGCDLLLDAFLATAALDPDLHLLFAGPAASPFADALKARAAASPCAARLHFPGMLLGPAKLGALAACQAFVLPSHQENFGIAVTEALAFGRPVLLSDQVNLAPEVLADHAGLVEPDTPAGVRALLTRWHGLHPADRDRLGRNALAAFHARYDMRRNAARLCELFRDQPAPAPAAPRSIQPEAR